MKKKSNRYIKLFAASIIKSKQNWNIYKEYLYCNDETLKKMKVHLKQGKQEP